MSQYARILALYDDKDIACQREFWAISKSPHKRRKDLEVTGKYLFQAIPCGHDMDRSFDYKLIRLEGAEPKKELNLLQRALLWK